MGKHAGYIREAFEQGELIDAATEELEGIEFDAMIGVGLSGSLVVPLLAREFGKRFGIVRKADDKITHSTHVVEHNLVSGDRWLFVDDFISTGDTRLWATDAMRRLHGDYMFAGQYLYHQHQSMRYMPAAAIAL